MACIEKIYTVLHLDPDLTVVGSYSSIEKARAGIKNYVKSYNGEDVGFNCRCTMWRLGREDIIRIVETVVDETLLLE